MNQLIFIFMPSIALISLGYFLKQKVITKDWFWNRSEKLNYYLLFPALIVSSLATVQAQFTQLHTMFRLVFAVMLAVIVLTYLVAVIKKTPVGRIGVYIQSMIRFNTYIGLSIALTLSDTSVKSMLVCILAISIPFVNVVSILSLTPKHQMNFRYIVIYLLKNPLINSCIIGILLNYFGIPVTGIFSSALNFLSQCSLLLGLLCVGAAINIAEIKKDIALSLLISVFRLILLPAAAILLISLTDLNHAAVLALMIFFSIPTASSAYVLTKILKGDYQLMAGIISLQTILSVVTLPLIIYGITRYL